MYHKKIEVHNYQFVFIENKNKNGHILAIAIKKINLIKNDKNLKISTKNMIIINICCCFIFKIFFFS